jgi:hypothetical protein
MIDDPSVGENGESFERARDYKNNVAIGVAVAILGVMAVAIAIDFSSVPNLALLTIVAIGGLIAALIAWG